MPRKPDERIIQAKELYLKGLKLVEIASQLSLPEGTVRRWKSTYKWDNERSDKNSERSDKKKGGQPSNKNAEKHGFFSKYLPEETFSIIQDIEKKNPLDILWENIQIAYAAIVRAQQIMYVKDHEDKTIEKIEEKEGNELLHSNYELATEEQKARIEQIRAKTAIISGVDEEETEDDGFLEALKGEAYAVWEEE